MKHPSTFSRLRQALALILMIAFTTTASALKANYDAATGTLNIFEAGTVSQSFLQGIAGASNAKIINIRNGVTGIGDRAFYDFDNVETITIPTSVTTIGSEAFSMCSKLRTVTFASTTTTVSIGAMAFRQAAVETVTIGRPFTYTKREYEASGVGSYGLFDYNRSLKKVVLRDYIQTLPEYTFYSTDISEVDMSAAAALRTIEGYAFGGCQYLKSVVIPAGVTTIKTKAFAVCFNLATASMMGNPTVETGAFPETTVLHRNLGLSYDQWLAQYSNKTLVTRITIPNDDVVHAIANSATPHLGDLFPNLANVTFSPLVTYVGSEMFMGAAKLQNVYLDGDAKNIYPKAFGACPKLTNVIGKVKNVQTSAFANCPLLRSVEIESGSTIGAQAFKGCTGLATINLPSDLTTVGASAFDGCTSLRLVVFNGDSFVGKTTWTETDNILTLFPNMTTATFNKDVTTIGANAFHGSPVSCLTTLNFTCRPAVGIASFAANPFLAVTTGTVQSVSASAFADCSSLSSVKVYDGAVIGSHAFDGCSSLRSFSSVTAIGEIENDAFRGCTSLASIDLPQGLTEIGDRAFFSCTSLKTVTLPASLTRLGSSVFSRCTGINSAVINSAISRLDNETFYGCSALSELTLPASLTSIASDALTGCTSLTTFICNAPTPIEVRNFYFGDVPTDRCQLFVPSASLDLYRQAEVWRDFYRIYPSDCTMLVDGQPYLRYDPGVVNSVRYTRDYSNTDWQALYVPFTMNYEDWADDFEVARISGMHAYDYDDDGEVDETSLEILRVTKGQLHQNTPYLIRAKEVGEHSIIRTGNVVLYPSASSSYDVSTWDHTFTFTGTYNVIPGTTMVANHYQALGRGELHEAEDTSNSLKPYRWYMAVTDRTGYAASVRRVTLRLVGEEDLLTGIVTPISDEESQTLSSSLLPLPSYLINGLPAEGATAKGVVIKGGKKVFVR